MSPTAARPAARPPARRVALPLLLAVLVLGLVLGGCARVRTALAVQPDDTVTGEIVAATPETSPQDTGPVVTVPSELGSAVEVEGYRQDGYTGSVLRFSNLTFEQVALLNQAVGPPGRAVRLEMRRVGGRILLGGKVDLTTATADRADFQLKISFPGRVLESDGEEDSGTVSWTFTPGKAGDVSAVVAYDDPQAPSPLRWTLGLAVVVAAAVVAVVILARRTRNPALSRPVR